MEVIACGQLPVYNWHEQNVINAEKTLNLKPNNKEWQSDD